MRTRILRRFALAALLVSLPSAAFAPPTQYEQYDADSTVIHDLKTTLVWERFMSRSKVTYTQAEAYCQGTFGGRVPTVKELLTIVEEEPHAEWESSTAVEKMIDGFAFPSTPVDLGFWSSTASPGNAGQNLTLSFATGTLATSDRGQTAYVRCVK